MFERSWEWSELTAFATDPEPGATLGVVSGRRRQGKTFLLDSLAQAAGGFYFQAVESTDAESLHQLGTALGQYTRAAAPLRFDGWAEAVDALLAVGSQSALPVVIDEFPYLVAQNRSLPSVIQAAYGPVRAQRLNSRARLLLCGSAISFMGRLLGGSAPLRGRAALEMVVRPLDFRQAARFWEIEDPRLAVLVHSVVGGTPAYRAFARSDTPASHQDFVPWLSRTALNESSPLFREARYLLAEESDLRDRALYHSILAAVSAGNHNRGGIAAYVGRSANDLSHPFTILEDCGLLKVEQDAFRTNRRTYRVAEPLLAFFHAVIRPVLAHVERHRTDTAWQQSQHAYSSGVLGPHFEAMCRDWVLDFAEVETFGGLPTEARSGTVADPAARTSHEVDVVVHGINGQDPGVLLSIGEVKWNKVMDLRHLDRLRHIRSLLQSKQVDVSRTGLACYSGAGFAPELHALAERGEVTLVDLRRLYHGT